MVSTGETHDMVARAIGVSRETLEKYFSNELTTGASRKRREVVELLYRSARGGNVSAIKKLEEMTRVGGAAAALREREQHGGEEAASVPARRAERLGKKEEQQRAAEQVGGKFAVPPAPKLVVVNE